MLEKKGVDGEAVASHVKRLLCDSRPPELPPELATVAELPLIHAQIITLRKLLDNYARGDFSAEIDMRGAVAGLLKSLQANTRHLIWQMDQVGEGNMEQRVDFMGEFSAAFNRMVRQLDGALTSIRQKEAELIRLTAELKIEVEKRDAAMSALQKSEEQFKYLAEHDPLTGLLNRRSFFAQAEMEIARNTIMSRPSSVALMDVDHFKRFNDTHGHPNGDIALRHIARVCTSALRDIDIMGRYGGEEFVFLFSKASHDQTILAADRIRRIIEANPVKLPGGEVALTASFGLAPIRLNLSSDPDFNPLEFAMGLADIALYKAKNEGRNRICSSE